MLYVGRCESCWKEPAVVAWLERNVRQAIDRLAGDVSEELLSQYAH